MTGSEAGDYGVATPLGREGTHDADVVHPSADARYGAVTIKPLPTISP
jgi:hypothetical protein